MKFGVVLAVCLAVQVVYGLREPEAEELSSSEYQPEDREFTRSVESSEEDDDDECWSWFVSHMTKKRRGFPKSAQVKEMTGYDRAVYDPFLVEYMNRNCKALKYKPEDIYLYKFSAKLLTTRYMCPGTKLNQILLSVLRDEAKTSLADKLSGMFGKGRKGKKGPLVKMLQYAFRKDVVGHFEMQEFEEVSCFFNELKALLVADDTDGLTIDELRKEVEQLVNNYESVFMCTKPSDVIEGYQQEIEGLDAPLKENKLYQHIRGMIMKYLRYTKYFMSKNKFEKLTDGLAMKAFNVFKSAVDHIRPLEQVSSTPQLLTFLGKNLSPGEMTIARELIKDMDLFSPTTVEPPTPAPTTPSPSPTSPPSLRRAIQLAREIERELIEEEEDIEPQYRNLDQRGYAHEY